MHARNLNSALFASTLFASTLVAACASTKAPSAAHITDEVVIEASVVSVDQDARRLTLEHPDGPRIVLIAGPEVRNLDQIEAGDTVRARYVVSLSARRLDPDEPETEPILSVAANRAAKGERPAGFVGAGVMMTVHVKSVDLDQNLVVFTDPEGVLHVVEPQRDEGREFIKGLKPGDRVELTYGETLALSVE